MAGIQYIFNSINEQANTAKNTTIVVDEIYT